MNETVTLERVTSLALRLKPIDQAKLVENLMKALEEKLAAEESVEDSLAAWHNVYGELPEEDIRAIENIVRDRTNFMKQGE
jgi:hemoglobin-like flavoprotein